MVLEDAPTTFDRIVLAMLWRIVRQPDCEMRLLHEGDESLPKLGAPAVILGAIIPIEHQGREANRATTSFTLVGHSADFTPSGPTRRA